MNLHLKRLFEELFYKLSSKIKLCIYSELFLDEYVSEKKYFKKAFRSKTNLISLFQEILENENQEFLNLAKKEQDSQKFKRKRRFVSIFAHRTGNNVLCSNVTV